MGSCGEYVLPNYQSFIDKMTAAGFEELDCGSFRLTFERKGVVIKVPMYSDGIIDNMVEHTAYHTYFNRPLSNGMLLAPCRLLPNGCLMMRKIDWDNYEGDSTDPHWGRLVDGGQYGPYKGRMVAYDYALDLTERFEWEKKWKRTSHFFNSKNWRRRRPHIDAYLNQKETERKARLKNMNREDMSKEVNEQLATLREQAQSLTKLCDSLQQMLRSQGGDVAFSTVEQAKLLVQEIKPGELKSSLDKTFKVLKARAVARVKEI